MSTVQMYRCDKCEKTAPARKELNVLTRPDGWVAGDGLDFCSYKCLSRYASEQEGILKGIIQLNDEGARADGK